MGSAEEKYILPQHVFSDPDNSSAHIESLHLGYVCLNTVATTGFAGFANTHLMVIIWTTSTLSFLPLFLMFRNSPFPRSYTSMTVARICQNLSEIRQFEAPAAAPTA
ncbi:hypothetical protein DAI22_03g104500 [Oryza sativa Japonica Group]|nr:hypothetical protein DAI22_03g104500 [Oryza sativa Japonica Group]